MMEATDFANWDDLAEFRPVPRQNDVGLIWWRSIARDGTRRGGLRLSALPRVNGSRSPVEGNRKGERYWSVARGSGGRPRTMLRDGRIDDGGHRPREVARR